jgi:hypothetical protein
MKKLMFLIPIVLFSCSVKEKHPFYFGDSYSNVKSITKTVYSDEHRKRKLLYTEVIFLEEGLMRQYIREKNSVNWNFNYSKTDTSYNKYTDGVLTQYTTDLGHTRWYVEDGKRTGAYQLFNDSDNSSSIYVGELSHGFNNSDTARIYDEFETHHRTSIHSGTGIEPYMTWEKDTTYYLEKDKYGNPLITSNPPIITYINYEYN